MFKLGDQVTVEKVVFEVVGVGTTTMIVRPVRLVWKDGGGMTLCELQDLAEQFMDVKEFADQLKPIIERYEHIGSNR